MAQLWGGRFTKETDQLVYNFNASISFDQKFYKEDIDFYREACENAFSYDEMRLIFEIIVQMQMPPHQFGEKIARFHYLSEKYAMLKLVSARTPIKNKFSYFLAMINNDRKKQQ